MPVASMTGFARAEALVAQARLVFELRSVNGKGLDLRLRLAPGFDALEPDIRKAAGAALSRGNVQITLQIQRDASGVGVSINEAVLRRYVERTSELVASGHASPPSADGLLALKGVIEIGDAQALVVDDGAMREAALSVFTEALAALAAARAAEGVQLVEVLHARLDEIERIVGEAEADPSRASHAIRERLAAQVCSLLAAGAPVEPERLAQEVAILATKADIREELDRLRAHIAAARALLDGAGPAGRRLDFLSQELNRESNTICSKSNSASLTRLGLELKVVVDQFREQVQNIE